MNEWWDLVHGILTPHHVRAEGVALNDRKESFVNDA
jgi:hypothetical protein